MLYARSTVIPVAAIAYKTVGKVNLTYGSNFMLLKAQPTLHIAERTTKS